MTTKPRVTQAELDAAIATFNQAVDEGMQTKSPLADEWCNWTKRMPSDYRVAPPPKPEPPRELFVDFFKDGEIAGFRKVADALTVRYILASSVPPPVDVERMIAHCVEINGYAAMRIRAWFADPKNVRQV